MYQYFIYLIISLIIYSTYEPVEFGTHSAWISLGAQVCLLIGFSAVCSILYRSVEYAYKNGTKSPGVLQKRYYSLNTQLNIFSLILFTISVYLFDLKYFVLNLPFLNKFYSISTIVGLGMYVCYLVILWSMSYRTARLLISGDISRFRFVTNRLRLSLSLLFPWFVITFLFDLAEFGSISILASLDPFMREILLFGLFLTVTVIFAPLFMRILWGLKSLPADSDRLAIEKVCARLKFYYRDIVTWPMFEGEIITAGVMGLLRQFRYLLISPSLLRILSAEEIESVIGHEVGHIRKYHLLYYVVFLLGYLVVIYPTFDLVYLIAVSNDIVYRFINTAPDHQLTLLSVVLTVPMLILFIVYFRFIFGYFIRNFERQADFFSLQVIGRSRPLINALEKIGFHSGNIRNMPSWHHFSIAERVEALADAENNSTIIKTHNRKLRRNLIIYLTAVVVFGYAGHAVKHSEIARQFNMKVVKRLLQRQVEQNPIDVRALTALSTLYYENGEFGKAEKGYQVILAMEPENPEVLNNLAWLYASCPDETYKRPREALRLAKAAAGLLNEPHILDTLAESFFINGFMEEAIEAIKKAISENPKDLEYYQGQLNKFEKARGEINGGKGG